jgi:iron complex transport system ATP-binding protein
MILEAKQLSVSLGGRQIVKNMSFQLNPNEVVGVIGANGSGKSTLLKAVAGLLPMDSGSVNLDGKPLLNYAPKEIARTMAYLPQGAECHWPLSVERVVALGRLPFRGMANLRPEHDKTLITRALEAVDALHLRTRVITELSGGERARVFLARALAGDPALMLIDEPAAGLDAYHHLQLMELLAARAHEGRGILVVMHELGMAARFCDRLLLIHDGELLASGAPGEVLTDELLAKAHRVRVFRAEYEGDSVLVPWSRIS